MSIAVSLEYAAFGSSLICSWVYGNKTIWGPILGIITAMIFIAFGLVSGIYAAAFANLIFLFVHGRNLRKHMSEDLKTQLAHCEDILSNLSKALETYRHERQTDLEEEVDELASGINRCRDICFYRSDMAGWLVG